MGCIPTESVYTGVLEVNTSTVCTFNMWCDVSTNNILAGLCSQLIRIHFSVVYSYTFIKTCMFKLVLKPVRVLPQMGHICIAWPISMERQMQQNGSGIARKCVQRLDNWNASREMCRP